MLEDLDSEKIQFSGMVFSGERKYTFFNGYKDDNHEIKPLSIMLPQSSAYVKIV